MSNGLIDIWGLYAKDKTISGHQIPYAINIYVEMYYHVFMDSLNAEASDSKKVYLSQEKNQKLIEMSMLEDVGDFIADPENQLVELATFGLVLLDRIAGGWERLSKDELFYLHEQLFECFQYIQDNKLIKLELPIIKKKIETSLTKEIKSDLGRRGAEKRHEENRAMKEDVFKWLDKHCNNYPSLDAAAEAIKYEEKLVPMSYRTIRDWITEWDKQQKD